jgi:hypothetical protein
LFVFTAEDAGGAEENQDQNLEPQRRKEHKGSQERSSENLTSAAKAVQQTLVNAGLKACVTQN